MDKHVRHLLVLLLSIAVIAVWTGCATTTPPRTGRAPEAEIVWPQAPDRPRIRFVQLLETPTDVGIRKSMMERFFDLFVGSQKEYLGLPQQLLISPDNTLYVTDQQRKCVHIFDLQKSRYRVIQKFRQDPLYSPAGVAVDGKGNVYVSDSVTRKVFVFDSRGNSLYEFGGTETFERPTGLVFLPQTESLYVIDTLAQNLKVFDTAGNLKFQFGTRGEEAGNFNYPTYICHDGNGRIYVTDTLNHRVQIFDQGGNFVAAFGKPGDTYGSFSKPKGVAVDSHGNIYVVDSLHDSVQIFDPTGRLLLSFCGPGSGPGQLWLPSGIAIDAENRIYVADTYNQRIQILELMEEKAGFE